MSAVYICVRVWPAMVCNVYVNGAERAATSGHMLVSRVGFPIGDVDARRDINTAMQCLQLATAS